MDCNEGRSLDIFIDETRDHLEGIEEDLLLIEQEGCEIHPEVIGKLFRAIHTIKGSSGFFGLRNIQQLSHHMESVLDGLRNGTLKPVHEIISLLLDGADTLRSMIENVEASDSVSVVPLIDKLQDAALPGDGGLLHPLLTGDKKVWNPVETVVTRVFGLQVTLDLERIREVQLQGNGKFVYVIEVGMLDDRIAASGSPERIIEEIGLFAKVISAGRASSPDTTNDNACAVVCVSSLVISVLAEFLEIPALQIQCIINGLVENDSAAHCYRLATPGTQKGTTAGAEHKSSLQVAHRESTEPQETAHADTLTKKIGVTGNDRHEPLSGTIRVGVGTLDHLMSLAGEMVLTRNELLQNLSMKNFSRVQAISQKVDSITTELQEAIMSTRMQSIGVVLRKFRRMVRDEAVQLGKQILVEIRGEDVELDKSIIEMIGDPLTHMVRNAICHGIETTEERVRAGKTPFGTVRIQASHEAGHVLVEIADDGRGIDPEVIKSKAKADGFSDEATLSAMSDADAIRLIFKPGFSTSEEITELSGRGVGMDVVLSNLKKVGGAVDIHSVVGTGTVFRITLPLTLAIIPALLIRVEDDRFAIPQSAIDELVRIPAADVKNKIALVGDAPVLRTRGALLPLISLVKVLGVTRRCVDAKTGIVFDDRRQTVADRRGSVTRSPMAVVEKRNEADRRQSHESAVNIAVVSAGDFRFGIIADALLDSVEIVVKPLGSHLCHCREYAGATILGDGHVALILDVVGLRRLVEVQSVRADSAFTRQNEVQAAVDDKESFLMIENALDEYFAIPLGLISRIDKVDVSTISATGGKLVVPRRGAMLRLVAIEDALHVNKRKLSSHVFVLVMQVSGREIGIIASAVLDIVDICASRVDCFTHIQQGIMGTVFLQDKIVVVVDPFGMVKVAAPELFVSGEGAASPAKKGSILIVEDSAFFRHQIRSFVEDEGYEVFCTGNGAEGMAFLDKGEPHVDLVLTDIEMPKMNGLELTRAIRNHVRLRELPVIAITSVSGDAAEQRGRDAGVNEYIIKFERQAVLDACKKYIHQ